MRTLSSTKGSPLSVRYAPTPTQQRSHSSGHQQRSAPKLTLLGLGSSLKAVDSPRMASGGACGTAVQARISLLEHAVCPASFCMPIGCSPDQERG